MVQLLIDRTTRTGRAPLSREKGYSLPPHPGEIRLQDFQQKGGKTPAFITCRLAERPDMPLRKARARVLLMNDPARRRASDLIRGFERVLVAFSGGIDSTLVLRLACQELGANAVAVTAVSPSLARRDLEASQDIAREIGAAHELIKSGETEDFRYQRNDPQRCYFCKTNVYQSLIDFAGREGFPWILDGTNADDTGDHRPGLQAAREHGVRSPLQEAGIGKEEIRTWARELGLSNWNLPANACLSSRVPYGSEVTPEKLAQIEQAEAALHKLGFRELRVRHHDQVARIEVSRNELPLAVEHGEHITSAMREAGFLYATLDLAGFRSGSMNDGLKKK